MTMLSRFRKPGGFLQLLRLVESCEPQKRTELCELIAAEDPGWAHLVRLKTLSLDRIFGWPEKALGKIWPHAPIPLIVALYQQAPLEHRKKIDSTLPRNFVSSFKKALDETPPLPHGEILVAKLKFVSLIRELQIEGLIRFEEFDPGLVFDAPWVEGQDPFKKVA